MPTKAQQAALAQLREIAAQPPPSHPAGSPAPAEAIPPSTPPQKAGRPQVDTEQISLRPPKAWLGVLRRRAAEASLAEGRTITPQQIILRLIEAEVTKDLKEPGGGG